MALTAPASGSGATIALIRFIFHRRQSCRRRLRDPARRYVHSVQRHRSQTVSTPTPVTLTATYLGVSEAFGLVINPTTAAPTGTAAFVKTDTTTAGTWKGVYGSRRVQSSSRRRHRQLSCPTSRVTPLGKCANYVWASSATDPRALQKASSTTDRIAACWFSGNSFTVDLNFTDTNTHQVALYLLDWDNDYVGRGAL